MNKNAYVTWCILCSHDAHANHMVLFTCGILAPKILQSSTIGHVSRSCTSCVLVAVIVGLD